MSSVDILQVAGKYTTLRCKGGHQEQEEWCGPCPKCGGTDRFLVWPNQGEFGKFHCGPGHRAGCDWHGDAIDLVRELENCNYHEARRRLGLQLDSIRQDTWAMKEDGQWHHYPINATYDYHDPDGKVIYQSLRWTDDQGNTKRFGQRQPDGTKRNGWRQGVRGVLLYPYRLPELIADIQAGHTVYIVEGEKAVNYLRSANIPATTNVGGTGMGWRKEYSQWFVGASVVVTADNDIPGIQHAQNIARSLLNIAANIVLKISGQWDELQGQGLDDWLKQGGAINDLPDLPGEMLTEGQLSSMPDSPGERLTANQQNSSSVETLKDDLITCEIDPQALRFNKVTRQIEYHHKLFDEQQRQILRFKMRGLGYGAPKTGPLRSLTAVEEGITLIAIEQAYHPIQEYLDNLPGWDGQDHLAALAGHFTCVNDDVEYQDGSRCSLFHALLRRWLIGNVSKIFAHTQNMVLVLCGDQGLGKSYLPKWLCPFPEYFQEGGITPDDKDCRIRHATKWIWEISEMGATTRRADVEALKSFLTTSQIIERRAYGKFDEVYPAMASFFGTLNHGEYLSDETGSRRFWTCTVNHINRAYSTTIDREQIWSQVMALWQSGEPPTLCPEEQLVVERQNRMHYQRESGFEGYLTRFFQPDSDGRMDASEIADHINRKLDRNVVSPRDIAGGTLRRSLVNVGYEAPKKIESFNGRKGRYWRITTTDQDIFPESGNSGNSGNSHLVTDEYCIGETQNNHGNKGNNHMEERKEGLYSALPDTTCTGRSATCKNTVTVVTEAREYTITKPETSGNNLVTDPVASLPPGWRWIQNGITGYWQAEREDGYRTSAYTEEQGGRQAVIEEVQRDAENPAAPGSQYD